TVEEQIVEALQVHKGLDRRAASAQALELMRLVGIVQPERRLQSYPFELSGDSRVIYGARISVVVGLGAVLVSAAVGMLGGRVAGYYSGAIGDLLMRIADIKLAMPMILFAIAWIAFFGGGLVSVIIVIGLWGW